MVVLERAWIESPAGTERRRGPVGRAERILMSVAVDIAADLTQCEM